ncbi:FAD-binding protein [Streptomyces noursei]|uniref:FAD-binding protein n=1 Tax=Streptomyces noursei TaxID=1971 RepID=UPI00381CB170
MNGLLAHHTTLRLGGPAETLFPHADPASWPDLVQAVGDQQPAVLGGGSNILAADAGYPGPVIRMTTRGISVCPAGGDDVEVTAQAGEPLNSVVGYTVSAGLSGIEYLGGIPGTIGAAPVQNAGAYGQQIADRLVSLTVWDWQTRRRQRLRAANCEFG